MKKILVVISSLLLSSSALLAIESQSAMVSVAKYKGDKTCAISFTFDDGLLEHYTLVAPKMEELGLKGTFWVWALCIENDTLKVDIPRMTWSQMREMNAKGHEISNHSWSHKNLPRLTTEQIREQIQRNDTAIFENIDIFPRTFCYPFNARNDMVIELASKDRVGTRTKQISIGSKSTPERFNNWVNDLLESKEWGVGMTHGITFGYDAFNDASLLWEHFAQVKAMEDSVWVGTFREVAAYVAERDNVKLDVIKNGNKLSVTPQVSLDNNLFTEPLTMVVERDNIKKITVKQGGTRVRTQLSSDKAIFDFNPFGGVISIEIK